MLNIQKSKLNEINNKKIVKLQEDLTIVEINDVKIDYGEVIQRAK